jgi:hypothetical protein
MRIRLSYIALSIVAGASFSSTGFAQDAVQNYCRTIPLRSDAIDWPSKHAWDLFVSLNHPAVDKKVARGVPDCTKQFGSPGMTSVWETWRNAGSEVYKGDGSEPPLWGDTTLPDETPGRVPRLPQPKIAANFTPRFSPGDGVFHNDGGFGETRINRATYEFIREQCLFSIEGQQRYAKAVVDGRKPPIQFPADSIEAKAAWLDFADPQGDGSVPPVSLEKQGTYYTAEFEGKKFGLTALHILTKDLTGWFWTTFRHRDTPTDAAETPDTFGPPGVVRGTVWENYRLGGTQTDFTLATGEPTLLSDHYVEFDFLKTSCMTCHSTATISPEIETSDSGKKFTSLANGQALAICSIQPDAKKVGFDNCKKLLGDAAFKSGTNVLVTPRGVPDPIWFRKDGKPFYMQTDFVYSIPFRGKSEATAPPPRCIW